VEACCEHHRVRLCVAKNLLDDLATNSWHVSLS
jgi:hypothetical protein